MTDPFASPGPVRLSLLTKQDCPLCEHAKAVLHRVEVDYLTKTEVVWLETPEGEAFAEKHQTPFPPVLVIDGELHAYGRLSEKKLRRDLELLSAPRRPLPGRVARRVGRLASWRPGRGDLCDDD